MWKFLWEIFNDIDTVGQYQTTVKHGKTWTECITSRWKANPSHDDVIKWKHFPRHWPFERGIHRSPVNSPHKGQWRGALIFSLIHTWTNGCINNCYVGYLRVQRAYYDVTVMANSNVNLVNFYKVAWLSSLWALQIIVLTAFSVTMQLSSWRCFV